MINKIFPIIFCLFIVFSPQKAGAFSGAQHAQDMLEVLLGPEAKSREATALLREFTKTIDNFSIIKGPNHRMIGHWGFSAAIPVNHGELGAYLSEVAATQGEAARLKLIEEIRAAWQADAHHLIKLSEKLLGIQGRPARGLAGLLYDVHLLGDYQGRYLGSLQNVDFLLADIEKCLYNIFGHHSMKGKSFAEAFKQGYLDSLAVCGRENVACRADKAITYLKESEQFRGYLAGFIKNKNVDAVSILAKTMDGKYILKKARNLSDYGKAARQEGAKNVQFVAPGLLKNGKLYVALKTGAGAGVMTFVADMTMPSYNYFKGNIARPEFIDKVSHAAINGSAVGGATAVAVLLGSNPAGLVIAGIGVGTYLAVDFTQKLWRQERNKRFVTAADLRALGFRIDSPLELKIDSPLELKIDSPLELRKDSPLELKIDSPLNF